MTIRILIADDHALLRGGIKQIIAATHDLRVIAEAATSTQVLKLCHEHTADLLLLDLTMPGMNGIELLQRLRNEHPGLPILILSMSNEKQIVRHAIKAGAAGYLTKDVHPEVLLTAIRKVARGGRFVDPALVETMMFPDAAGDTDVPPHELLSEREFQILKLLIAGHKINDIANQLNLSPKTVSTYKLRLMQKLDIDNNADLIRYAIRQNISPDLPNLEQYLSSEQAPADRYL
ncbi:Two component transcriptional regulator, LuxR family [Sterolibacterium denitrificans]|uniref:Two component transcriptional regulator, LuxR family n=1 Tax=Sterolibacterium denitrificans TaxID=157592 RepID=A0A7Z7HSB0_9PROT|nr:response regulator transcription factor [Sterolibacterium denitrificans]SMB29383.1 Two component transcriptional regulator, LuxR family [Sterolibacterium denitrificans]